MPRPRRHIPLTGAGSGRLSSVKIILRHHGRNMSSHVHLSIFKTRRIIITYRPRAFVSPF